MRLLPTQGKWGGVSRRLSPEQRAVEAALAMCVCGKRGGQSGDTKLQQNACLH